MVAPVLSATQAEVLQLFQGGGLVEAIAPMLSTDPASPMLLALVELHNGGHIYLPDLLETAGELQERCVER